MQKLRLISLSYACLALALSWGACPFGLAAADEVNRDERNDDVERLTKAWLDQLGSDLDRDLNAIDLTKSIMLLVSDFPVDDQASKNRIAILALGGVLGDDRIQDLTQVKLADAQAKTVEKIRRQAKFEDRSDLSRHFFASAALAVLLGPEVTWTVGVSKELADAKPQGTGFSFVDLLANRAGIEFSQRALDPGQEPEAFREWCIRSLTAEAIFPNISDLPEGIHLPEFDADYGGVSGEETRRITSIIAERAKALEYPSLKKQSR